MTQDSEIFHIKPGGSIGCWYTIKELWQSRDALIILLYRQITLRYRNTIIGILWIVLRPLFFVTIFWFAFGSKKVFAFGDTSYFAGALLGYMVWQLIAGTANEATMIVHADRALITKNYLPRLILPGVYALANFFDFILTLLLVLVVFTFLGLLKFSLVPFVLATFLSLLLTFGVTLWSCLLSLCFKDYRFALPFVIQAVFFVTPIIFPLSHLGGFAQKILCLNPLTGVLGLFRMGLLGYSDNFLIVSVMLSFMVSTLFATSAIYLFDKTLGGLSDSL